ncbi:hypothetical protein J2S51_006474 [Streptomyces sp. DSM 41269]|nr:hypothetical protein [Streptomyces sp. DSM 41269]
MRAALTGAAYAANFEEQAVVLREAVEDLPVHSGPTRYG